MNDKFEMHSSNYDKVLYVPYISGCYMVFRSEVLEKVMFDENIFMHMEDAEISRQVLDNGYKNVMYPEVVVVHRWERGTHKSADIKKATIKSVKYYFNKYGWFFDSGRRKYNKEARFFNEKDSNDNM
jgi:GT2 family glycosyltransferase